MIKVDKGIIKPIFILFLVILLLYISLLSYYHFNSIYPSISSFNKHPEFYDGIKIEKIGMMKNISNNAFILISDKNEVMVKTNYNNVEPVKKGLVIVNGVYNSEGYIDLIDIHYSHHHYIKYLISFIALIIVLAHLFKEWRLTKRGFTSDA